MKKQIHTISSKRGFLALSPLIAFILLYLVTSIIFNDFYKVPIIVAFMFSSIFAISIFKHTPLRVRIKTFSKGAGSENMMMMLWIFVLAGAFANSAKVMGSVDAMVNLTLSVFPSNMLFMGLFIASCFISISIGTSVGTIVALAPIAAGIATNTGCSLPFILAIVVGGSFFGDNLSFISDTTVIATRTQGCNMSDKFKVNLFIVAPVAFILLILYVLLGTQTHVPPSNNPIEYLKVLPYMTVLVCAICGLNVMVVLTIGLFLTGLIGVFSGIYDIFGWFSCVREGILGMGDLIIITMMAGGILEIIRKNGGIDFIIQHITKHIKGRIGAEITIAFLVSLVNICTANNTVAILTVGDIAKQIGDKYGVDKRKVASILDTFSCFIQGLIPYGAQILMAAGLAKINPISIIPYLYYPMLLGLIATLSIIFQYPRKLEFI